MFQARLIAAALTLFSGFGPFAHPVAGAAGEPVQVSRAFGFDVGEERRYVLGPPEALDPGEAATWLMRLDHVRDNGEAVFLLEHHRSGPDTTTGTPAYGEELSADMEGELTVNEHGFPVKLSFDVQRSAYGYADDNFYVRYEFDGRSLQKRVNTFGKQWDIAIPISGHRNLDKSVPIGLYLFLPDAFHCIGYRPSIVRVRPIELPRATTGSGLSPSSAMPRVDRYARACEPNTDLGFLNPGLLSLAWPAVIEAGDEEDFLFFTPTGADLFPGPRTSVSVAGIGGTGSRGGGGIDRARDQSRYYAYSQIELGSSTSIRLRGRTLDAIAAEVRGLPGEVYFDADGKVLLIDITATRFIEANLYNVIGGGMIAFNPDELERRFIRLMFPSEY